MRKISSFGNDFLDILFPNLCLGCHSPLMAKEELICCHCKADLPFTRQYLFKENKLKSSLSGRLQIEKAASLFYLLKAGLMEQLMYEMKYQGCKELAFYFGKIFSNELCPNWLDDIDIIVPVPLSIKKKRIRGYNQSEYFGMGLVNGAVKSIILENNLLIRKKGNQSQTRRGRIERWNNVQYAFDLNSEIQPEGKHILLVDDVVTTGSTIEACFQVLNRIKNVKISVLSIATAKNI